ncbi:putative leader peptide [Streptacidiphilus sp. N1-10]|uniref:Leader peptide n=1 Tax=Streptacidiphilus jeojiensis TaxID=3229225 RepID=A0ABV6XQD1_9ACTN
MGMGRYDDSVSPGLVDHSFAGSTSRRHVDLLRVSSALCPAVTLRATLRLTGPAR